MLLLFICLMQIVICLHKCDFVVGIIVGVKKHQKPHIPKTDTNNVVLIDDNGTPLGTRIHVPIPSMLRTILKEKTLSKGADYTKLLAIATRFVWWKRQIIVAIHEFFCAYYYYFYLMNMYRFLDKTGLHWNLIPLVYICNIFPHQGMFICMHL